MSVVLIGFAFLRLILAIVFTIAGLYIASWVLGKVTKEINEWEEIRKGNSAVAIYMAGHLHIRGNHRGPWHHRTVQDH